MVEQIGPEDLMAHQVSHQMLGACCLCPLVDPNAPDFMESAMYKATDSKFLGQFVATCAHNRCNYIGRSFQWLAPLQNFHGKLCKYYTTVLNLHWIINVSIRLIVMVILTLQWNHPPLHWLATTSKKPKTQTKASYISKSTTQSKTTDL